MPTVPDLKQHRKSPGVQDTGRPSVVRVNRIPHAELIDTFKTSSGGGRGIVEIYRQEVLPVQTRNIPLLGHKCSARIIHTLLGFEVQAEYKRIQCPDLVTARFLKLFSELGCKRIRLPYDPTLTAKLIPELEAAQNTLAEGVRKLFPQSRPLQVYVLRRIYHHLRGRLRED